MRRRLLLFAAITSMLLSISFGCKKSTRNAADDVVVETTSTTTSAPTETSAKAPAKATTGGTIDRRTIALAMGCAEDKLTEDGCEECVGSWSVEGEDSGLVQNLTLRPGKYSDSGKEQVYITYFGCGSRAGGDSHNVLLERDGDAWKIARRTTYKDNQTCYYPKQADGIEHVLCVNVSGSQGVEYQDLISPAFSNFKGIDATGDKPLELGFDQIGGMIFASTTNEEMEEDEDGMLPRAPEIKVAAIEDIDGDGDQDARVLIDGDKYNIVIDHEARTMTLVKPSK